MPRWDYDTVLYRVFCITLLGIAFTFTIVLTNVFIDIDGLLYKKSKAKNDIIESVNAVENVISTDIKPDDAYDYREYGDYSGERTKRSLDSQDFSFHVKDPKIKEVITKRLAELLDDLEKEEASKSVDKKIVLTNRKDDITNKVGAYKEMNFKNVQNKNNDKKAFDVEILNSKKVENERIEILDDIQRIKKKKDEKMNKTEELKHLAMHNIILEGIIGHMDLGDVYARVHALVNDLGNTGVTDKLKEILYPVHDKKFFEEIMNCKELRNEIIEQSLNRETLTTTEPPKDTKSAGRNVMIQAIIDITSLANDRNNQDGSSRENVNGIIKLIYNGKALKFKRVKERDENITEKQRHITFKSENIDMNYLGKSNDRAHYTDSVDNEPKVHMNSIIKEYLNNYFKDSEDKTKVTTKRLKRHIKIRYENDETTTGVPKNNKNSEDELFVEIDTHFDSKGLKGEKKKKMIRDLVEKIQHAILSEKEVKKKKHKHLHVKKRTQNRLDNINVVDKMFSPLNNLIHRDLDPISKSVPVHEKLPYFSDNKGENWRKDYLSPNYLSLSKGINSAELNEINREYNIVAENGIPQRLQQPLNSDYEALNNNVNDPSNVKLLLKDIAGSGFSIGFNQYVAEPPDADSMRLFTGIKDIIQTYHQKYDENVATDEINGDTSPNLEENEPQNDYHTIIRRSAKNSRQDYHSNEYKKLYSKDFFKLYNQHGEYSKGHWSIAKNTVTKKQYPSLVIDDNILERDLKPSEILRLASLLYRKKRSLNVKKISNIKNKKKLNRYLNTQPMASKMINLQKKRNKRQLKKIRIIAKDSSKYKHNSEEEIFVSSDEKIFADRAVVKEVEAPEMVSGSKMNENHYDVILPHQIAQEHYDVITPQKGHMRSEEHYDVISPQKVTDNHYDIISPYYEAPETFNNNVFTRRSRHNSLMSRYPHIFMEEITKSKEDYTMPDNAILYGNMIDKLPVKVDNTNKSTPAVDVSPYVPNYTMPEYQETDFDPEEKSNYKVTVKIMPKNTTGINSGFKEVHTSINKSYNKNGLKFTSLVNVSEVSKVEKINKTLGDATQTNPSVTKMKRDHLRIKSLIQQHKDRIEEQLAHLNQEKEKLEKMDMKNTENLKEVGINTFNEQVDIPFPTDPERRLYLTKEELGKPHHFEQVTTENPATIITTTEYIEPTLDPTKKKIINSIERNENYTKEILKKIDKNTDLLKTFLDKLINKIEETTVKHDVYIKPESEYTNDEDKTKEQVPKTQQILRNEYSQMPNMFFNPRANSTGIPFIYAFQQPYTMANNKDIPISSVVYQGHIHANTVNYKPTKLGENGRKFWKDNGLKKLNWPDKPQAMSEVNGTKFFIDEQNDYKVLPIVVKNTFPLENESTNTTKI